MEEGTGSRPGSGIYDCTRTGLWQFFLEMVRENLRRVGRARAGRGRVTERKHEARTAQNANAIDFR